MHKPNELDPVRGILYAIPLAVLCWLAIYGVYLAFKWVVG